MRRGKGRNNDYTRMKGSERERERERERRKGDKAETISTA